MRGKKAKKLRKTVYGSDFSPRERRYVKEIKTKTIRNIGKRKQYQELKKESKKQ